MSDQEQDDNTAALATDRRRPGRLNVDPSLISLLRGQTEAGAVPPFAGASARPSPSSADIRRTRRLIGFDGLDAVSGIAASLAVGALMWLVVAGVFWLI